MKYLIDGDVLVIGCGNMGGALLERWMIKSLLPSRLWVEDPYPSERLQHLFARGAHVNQVRPVRPDLVILAVKPQAITEILPDLANLPLDVPVLSIVAGIPLAQYAAVLGNRPIIRAMPNLPALIGRGVSAIIGNCYARPDHLALASTLFSTVGTVVMLDSEMEIDAVTAISGSGPAYVFLFTEVLQSAAEELGLSGVMARQLAQRTVAGAAELMVSSDRRPDELREEVTSANGTTAAALAVLMELEVLQVLISRAVRAAHDRSIELSSPMEFETRAMLTQPVVHETVSSLDAGFCVQALNKAIHRFGPPEILNTDQGSQFTSFDWIDRLKRAKTKISIDGKARYLDKFVIEPV